MDQQSGEPAEGEVVAQRYHVLGLVGRGGMGAVYRAEDSGLRRTVALKFIKPEHANRSEYRDAFRRESSLASQIKHSNVVSVHRGGDDAGRLYLAMEYVEGRNLGTHIECEGPMSPGEALEYLRDIASALDEIHRHDLVHADVKPANILIAGGRAFLTDFGIARQSRLREAVRSLTTDDPWTGYVKDLVAGTSAYMAPEQWLDKAIDGRVDIYGLGGVLYTMLTGRRPYDGDDATPLRNAHLEQPPPTPSLLVSGAKALDEVVHTAMAKSPDDRYQSGAAMAAAASALSGIPTRRHSLRRMLAPLALVGVIAAVVLGVLLPRVGQGGPPTTITTAATTLPPAIPAQPTSSSQTIAPVTPLVDFRDDEAGFSIRYPQAWRRVQVSNADYRLAVDGGKNVAFTVRVVPMAVPATAANLANLKAVTDGLVGSNTTVKVTNIQTVSINGMLGYNYFYSFTDGAVQAVHAHYFLFSGHKMNILVFQSLPDEFDALKPVFLGIVDSFQSQPN